MIGLAALLADVNWGALIPIFLFVIWILNQLLSAAGKGQKAPKPAERPRPRPAPINPRRQELNDEVGEFLRRAAEKRGGQPAPAEAAREQRAAAAARQAQRAVEPVAVQAVDEPPSGSRVAAHVQQHLGTQQFSRRAGQLPPVDQADELLDSHLHQVFDHQLGSLGGLGIQAAEPAELTTESADNQALPTTATAEALASLLANPQTLRGAIVLNEIFTRPEHRW